MRAKFINEGKKKTVKKKAKKRELKAGEVVDPTMPIIIPKNNEKIFKMMQKKMGLKPYTEGAALKEELEAIERINNIVLYDEKEKLINNIKNITNNLLDEGFFISEIQLYLNKIVRDVIK